MTVSEDFQETRCTECGHLADPSATIPSLDGRGRRCSNQEACHDRKEDRSAFSPVVA